MGTPARTVGSLCVIAVMTVSFGCGSPPTSPARLPPFTTPPLPGGLSATMTAMLGKLAEYIVAVYAENLALLPRNPQFASQIQAKLSMLSNPGQLIREIFDERRWVEGSAPAPIGGATPIGAVFPLESMRAECGDAVRTLEAVLPAPALQLWYGFKVGGTGGGGAIYMVDRTTQATFPAPAFPISYEATLAHEAAHSYISNEALTQFLEVYVHNVMRGRGVNPDNWDFTRGWSPVSPSPFGVSVVLDVYGLVGHEVMQRAYRAIRPLRPAYGQPLTAAVLDAFVAQVPEAQRATVRAKLATIIA